MSGVMFAPWIVQECRAQVAVGAARALLLERLWYVEHSAEATREWDLAEVGARGRNRYCRAALRSTIVQFVRGRYSVVAAGEAEALQQSG